MTLVMAVVNVTPDSFSDGGRWFHPDPAVAHARDLVVEGAQILDIGGESTRPGAVRPDTEEELRRVLPVVSALVAGGTAARVPISVDTMRADVARATVGAGATMINDVSGGLADPAMLDTVAALGVDYVCMHWRGFLGDSSTDATYADVSDDVFDELGTRRDACLAAGIAPDRLILDPGIGFSKDADENWQLLADLDRFVTMGQRLVVGVSRKRFLGTLLGGREPSGRDDATAAISVVCAQQGVWAVRTHTVRQHRDAIAVVDRLARSRR